MAAILKHSNKISLFLYVWSCPLSALASISFALSLQPIIDVGMSSDARGLVVTIAVAILIACINVLLSYIQNMQKKKVVISFIKDLRISYFRRFFSQNIARFLERDSAVYISKLTVEAEEIGKKYCESILNLYGSLWSLAISIACIASTRWELAVYVILISFVSVKLPKLFQERANSAEQDYLSSSNSHINLTQESVRNYLVIRLFKLAASQLNKYQQAISDVEKKDYSRQRRYSTVDAAASFISCISFILIIALCMLFVLQGKLSVGYTMSVSQLLGGVMYPFEMLPGYLVSYRAGRNIYKKNEAELQETMNVEGYQKLCLSKSKNYIELNKLSFTYKVDHPILLNEISYSFELKKKYAVVGKSGSGKSTLAKIIMGLLEPNSGTVSINGTSLSQVDKCALYEVFAFQSQTVSFFDGTIKENILLGKHLSDNTWNQIVTAACLDDMLSRLPDRELTIIEENGKNISGGEAQRICLARCLAKQPLFIIFDEIAASLDALNAAAIEKSILSLKNIGVLQITHRICEENMRQYDCILVLKDGRISEQGTWNELMGKKGDFYQLVVYNHDLNSGNP